MKAAISASIDAGRSGIARASVQSGQQIAKSCNKAPAGNGLAQGSSGLSW